MPAPPRWSVAARGLARRAAPPLLAAAVGGALAPACGRDEGVVEIAWSFVDSSGRAVFPSGGLNDTCAMTGRLGAGDPRSYALHLEIRLCDPACPGGCDDPACWHEDPLRFGCDVARGSAIVAAQPDPVLVDARVVAVALGDPACACAVEPPCAQVPGPRLRQLRAGLVTDLHVYLLVLALPDPERAALDLDACCQLPPSCA